jgi:hypothetical protein
MRQHLVFLALTLFLGGCPSLTHACEGKQVLFEDNFTKPDPSWGPNNDVFQAGAGKAVLKVLANSPAWKWNPAYVFETADICAEAKLAQGQWTPDTGVGLMFWVVDNWAFYTITVYGSGNALAYRRVGGRWLPSLLSAKVDGLKLEGADPIKLRVVLHGAIASFFVNGKRVGEIKGQPPAGGGNFGVYAQTEEPNKEALFDFTNFKVTSVP